MAILCYSQSCAKNEAGNTNLFITEVANISSVTISGGEVTGLSMESGKSFYEVEADRDSIIRTEDVNMSYGIEQSWSHRIDFTAEKNRVALNKFTEQLRDASHNGITAIVVDSNSQSWLVGWNSVVEYMRALYLRSYNYSSQESITGIPKIDFNLFIKSECKDLPFDSTLNDYILGSIGSIDFYQALATPDGDVLLTPDGQILIL